MSTTAETMSDVDFARELEHALEHEPTTAVEAQLHGVVKEIVRRWGFRPFIDVVFDGPPGPTSGRFVEVENAEGLSVRAGTWIDRGNGYWSLRIGETADAPTGPAPELFPGTKDALANLTIREK